jgi:hypothetical protein
MINAMWGMWGTGNVRLSHMPYNNIICPSKCGTAKSTQQ